MALDSRFILASDLQEYFVDKDTGTPLANGSITFYSDVNRTTLKPVYQLSGSPPNYSYTQLPNPLPLTGVGTISDGAGNDIVPYYFPYQGTPTTSDGTVELYYIVVESQGMALQFTREAWPNVVAASSTSQNLTNYVPDGQFRIHTDVPKTDTTVAGQITQAITYLAQGGWTFERPAMSTATDIVLFNVFGSAVTNPTGYPRFSVQIINQVPNAGDGFKDLRLKFDDVNKFASTTQQYTFAFSGQSNTGGSITASLILIKNFGTPNGSPTQETALATFTISPSYTTLQKTFTFGTNEAFSIGSNNDDFLQLAIRFPVASVFDVSLTDFILTPGAAMVSQFPTTTDAKFRYESIAGWMPTPAPDGSDLLLPLKLTLQGLEFDHSEVGKVYASVYATPGLGELLCDGTQYETAGYFPGGVPCSRLQSILWRANEGFPIYGTGVDSLTAHFTDLPGLIQLFVFTNKVGLVTNTADGSAPTNFTFTTLFQGSTTYHFQGVFFGVNRFGIWQDVAGLLVGNISAGTSGFTIATLVNQAFSRGVLIVQTVGATGLAGKYFTFGNTSSACYVWFKVDGVGTDPAPGGFGIEVDLKSTMDATDVANATASAVSGRQATLIDFNAASTVTAGAFFTINTVLVPFYVWYTVDGVGADPKPIGRTSIGPVALASTDTAAIVASKTQVAINGKYFAVPNFSGMFLRSWGNVNSADPDSGTRWAANPFSYGNVIGSFQFSELISHAHPFLDGTYTGLKDDTGGGPGTLNVGTALASTTGNYGGSESRPINANINYLIKY